jgi:hypothetical protein
LTIQLPTAVYANASDMLSFWVDIYDYNLNESVSIFVYGYPNGSVGSWANCGATILTPRTDRDYNVRFGHDGTRQVVCIGEINSGWSYPQVVVRDVQAGYTASVDTLDDGWGITFLTTLPTVIVTSSGNTVVAKQLQTARTIGGVSFDGTANINLPGVNTTGNQNTTGSAATLTTARTIGGVSFNGSANINLPGVNTAGNQNTTGNAATATNVAWSGVTSTPTTLSGYSVAQLSVNPNTSAVNADTFEKTGIHYVGALSLLGQTDGALYANAYSTAWQHQIFGDYRTGQIVVRGKDNGTFGAWRTVLDSGNFNSYAPTLTGTGASGSWGISVTGSSASTTGNAATATTLQTARTIGGVSFNGSANINLPGVNTTGNQNTTGSAATLTTARTIGGVSFNGSANINLPGVNTAGNQNTTGNAGTVTNGVYTTNSVLINRTAIADTALDTTTTTGLYSVSYTGFSKSMLTWNVGGSTGPVQFEVNYSNTGEIRLRNQTDSTTWSSWRTFLTNFNYNSYSPTLTGTGASGSWGISVTGSSASTTGNAATATALQNARTIGGVSFNGTANINLPGVNTAGNQNTTGNAANVTGTVAVANGGTGQTSYTNGQLLIGNTTGNTLAKATLTAGTGITVTNGAGAVTIAATNNGTVTSVGGTGTVNGITLTGTVTGSGNLTLGGTLAIAATQITSGTLSVARGGTGATTLTANNVILGNGTSAPLFVAPSTSGNVLTSNGTTWTSAALPAGGLTYVVKTANYTAVDKQGVLADTAGGAFTVTLPATPATGAQVVVADSGSFWGTNNLTVARNGSTIGGLAENLVCDITGASVQFVYDGSTWEVYAQIGGNGGTAVTLTGTQTLTNKTINLTSNTLLATSAQMAAAVTDKTGSGALVFATSPTLVTPVLGTPSSGTLSSCTVDGTNAVGFRNVPQNSRSAAYTLVLADAGKHIFHPVADNNARTFTIPANSSVAYPIGTAITFINMAVANVTIAITSDTLTLSPAGTTGSRTLAQNGSATCIKITSTQWLISGSGLT